MNDHERSNRERLIEILREPTHIMDGPNSIGETRMSYSDAETIADRLLANGVCFKLIITRKENPDGK